MADKELQLSELDEETRHKLLGSLEERYQPTKDDEDQGDDPDESDDDDGADGSR